MTSREEYLLDPCRASSLPYWKTMKMPIPPHVKIVHHDDLSPADPLLPKYDAYFRLKHDLTDISEPVLPTGYSLRPFTLTELAAHIGSCYEMHFPEERLQSMSRLQVYHPDLWITVWNDQTDCIAASGIADFDADIGEGVLEWIQVSSEHRRHGLGQFIVLMLLQRMKPHARFATVSGRCDNHTNPEAMYRSCGFQGNDVWHVFIDHDNN